MRMERTDKEKLSLEEEGKRATTLLQGKVVAQVWRYQPKEIGIEFTDGTRLFIDHKLDELEISIT